MLCHESMLSETLVNLILKLLIAAVRWLTHEFDSVIGLYYAAASLITNGVL